jgi:8-oxo-dGTP pyrophosphatase MutT (NUDIX family)
MNVKKNTSTLTSSKKQYDSFRKYFPFSCADLILFEDDSILLTKRTQNPFKGMWHLPGTMIRKDEKIEEAVKRAGETELGLKVSIIQYVGFFESIDNFRHDISHGFIVKTKKIQIKIDFQSNDYKFFKRLPKNLVPHHKIMIKKAREILKI